MYFICLMYIYTTNTINVATIFYNIQLSIFIVLELVKIKNTYLLLENKVILNIIGSIHSY